MGKNTGLCSNSSRPFLPKATSTDEWGGGVAQAILDERADDAQRDAILIDTSYGPQGIVGL